MTKKHEKLPSMQRVKVKFYMCDTNLAVVFAWLSLMVRFLTRAVKAESDCVLYTGLLFGWKARSGAPFGFSLLLPDDTLSGREVSLKILARFIQARLCKIQGLFKDF